MKIVGKRIDDLSKEELSKRRNELISELNNAGINPDLRSRHWKDRERKTSNYQFQLEELSNINKILGIKGGLADIYEGLKNDSIGGFD